jgi:hypothetical protein
MALGKEMSSLKMPAIDAAKLRVVQAGGPPGWLCRFLNARSEALAERLLGEEMAAFTFITSGGSLRAWNPQDLTACQTWARDVIDAYARGRAITLTLQAHDLTITPPDVMHTQPKTTRGTDPGLVAFRATLISVLANLPKFLKRCDHLPCANFFVTARNDQHFCRTRCTSLFMTKKHRDRLKRLKAAQGARRRPASPSPSEYADSILHTLHTE